MIAAPTPMMRRMMADRPTVSRSRKLLLALLRSRMRSTADSSGVGRQTIDKTDGDLALGGDDNLLLEGTQGFVPDGNAPNTRGQARNSESPSFIRDRKVGMLKCHYIASHELVRVAL